MNTTNKIQQKKNHKKVKCNNYKTTICYILICQIIKSKPPIGNNIIAHRDVATLWPGGGGEGAMAPPGFWGKKFSISIGIFNVNIQLAQKN